MKKPQMILCLPSSLYAFETMKQARTLVFVMRNDKLEGPNGGKIVQNFVKNWWTIPCFDNCQANPLPIVVDGLVAVS